MGPSSGPWLGLPWGPLFMLSWGLFQAVLHSLRTLAVKEGHFYALGSEPGVLWADSVFTSVFWDPHPRGIDIRPDFSGDFFSPLHFQALDCSAPPCGFLGLEGTASLGLLRQLSVAVLMGRWKGQDRTEGKGSLDG